MIVYNLKFIIHQTVFSYFRYMLSQITLANCLMYLNFGYFEAKNHMSSCILTSSISVFQTKKKMNMQRQIQELVFGFFTLIGNLCVRRDAARRADASVAGI